MGLVHDTPYDFLEYIVDHGIETDYFAEMDFQNLLSANLSIVKMAYLRGCKIEPGDIGRFVFYGNYPVVKYFIEESDLGIEIEYMRSEDMILKALSSSSLEMVKYIESFSENFSHEKAFYCLSLLTIFVSWSPEIVEYLISHIPDVNTMFVDEKVRTMVEDFEKKSFGLTSQHHFQRENEALITLHPGPIHILSEMAYENNRHAIELLLKHGLNPEINGDLPLKISDKYNLAAIGATIKKAMEKKLIN